MTKWLKLRMWLKLRLSGTLPVRPLRKLLSFVASGVSLVGRSVCLGSSRKLEGVNQESRIKVNRNSGPPYLIPIKHQVQYDNWEAVSNYPNDNKMARWVKEYGGILDLTGMSFPTVYVAPGDTIDFTVNVSFHDPKIAVLFKLTFGGRT